MDRESDKIMNTQNIDELLDEISQLRTEIQKLKKQKRYGLVWEDKPEIFDQESQDALPVFWSKKVGKFKDLISRTRDEDFNILIEGDNYHSLSVLNYTHRNKIDVIYIDPPYNTGNKDFIYNDHIVDKEDSFRHSKWLSFMNKRLQLAKDLLADDGVIFISIDDNEYAQLKLLCDHVFGQENYINTFIWINNLKGRQISNIGASQTHEFILCYAKDIATTPIFIGNGQMLKKQMPNIYKLKDYEVSVDNHGKFIIKNELYKHQFFF